MIDKINEDNGVLLPRDILQDFLIPTNGEIIVDKRNAIPLRKYEYFPAESLGNAGEGSYFCKMAFGNGGTSIDLQVLLFI